jgi:hypothetical protein
LKPIWHRRQYRGRVIVRCWQKTGVAISLARAASGKRHRFSAIQQVAQTLASYERTRLAGISRSWLRSKAAGVRFDQTSASRRRRCRIVFGGRERFSSRPW